MLKKLLVALVASAFALGAFAQDKKEESQAPAAQTAPKAKAKHKAVKKAKSKKSAKKAMKKEEGK